MKLYRMEFSATVDVLASAFVYAGGGLLGESRVSSSSRRPNSFLGAQADALRQGDRIVFTGIAAFEMKESGWNLTGLSWDVVVDSTARPLAQAQIGALRERRSLLSGMLQSATRRRAQALQQLRDAPAEARAGAQHRVDLADQLIRRIEADIAANEQLLTRSPPS